MLIVCNDNRIDQYKGISTHQQETFRFTAYKYRVSFLLFILSLHRERSSAEDGNLDKFSIIDYIPLFIAH